jgi:phosphatidylserine/phosphatidylglycerophosphate/cardiolipin synthase-like enzyme
MGRGVFFTFGLLSGILLSIFIQPALFPPSIETVFSPEDGAKVITLIDGAQETIDIEIYVFSSRDVVEALMRAKERGVFVRVIIERNVIGDDNEEIFRELASKGFQARYAGKAYKLTHAKIMIIDGKTVLVGSHNLSNSALFKNREASVIIRDSPTVAEFNDAFELDWALAS